MAKTAIIARLLLPVWFDADASQGRPCLALQLTIRGITQPRPEGAYLYYASLALAAGDIAEFNRVLPSIRGEDPATAPWRDILLAQQEVLAGHSGSQVTRCDPRLISLPESCRPAALYWAGPRPMCSPADEPTDPRRHPRALDSPCSPMDTQQPELAAAGLYHQLRHWISSKMTAARPPCAAN
jgi:hypothetical protein